LRFLRSLGGITILYYGASSFVAGGLGLTIRWAEPDPWTRSF